MKHPWIPVAGTVLALLAGVLPLSAQGDISLLRINEVIADNLSVPPVDADGGTPDMVEIFNTGDMIIILDGLAMSDTFTLQEAKATDKLYVFQSGVTIPGGKSLVIFCDNQTELDCIEPHASFKIDADGTEPVSLWGPADADGKRTIIDQVMLPSLRQDVSFGRYPDGAGPAPVPIDETFDVFRFMPAPKTSFGTTCVEITGAVCPGGAVKHLCPGKPNTPGANIAPRISRSAHSTNSPAAGEAFDITTRVRDDSTPVPPNIARAEIIYRVTREDTTGDWQSEALTWDSTVGDDGILTDEAKGRPLDRWSVWTGSIPGQEAGARVEFYLEVEDTAGALSTRPLDLCFRVLVDEKQPPTVCDDQVEDADGIGPCDSEFGGPNCLDDPCRVDRYIPCDVPWTYAVGYEPRDDLALLVINEIVAGQLHDPFNATDPVTGIVEDSTSADFTLCGFFNAPPKYCCTSDDPETCGYDDYIELYNTSTDTAINISGLWLSDRHFSPQLYKFPEGVMIGPGEHLIVWCDDDGGKCPDANRDEVLMPGFWECPDPDDATKGEFHTNFELSGDRDQIFLFDNEAHGFGLIHGVAFVDQTDNVALALCPDGDRSAGFSLEPGGSPGEANICAPPMNLFKRGDSNNDNAVELSDGVKTLDFLFQGKAPPPCMSAADVNADGRVDISDASATFGFLFLGRASPVLPFPDCGVDPANLQTDCQESICNG